MTEYYCEQLTNATYKCSEIVAESSSGSDGFFMWIIPLAILGALLLGVAMADF